MKTTIRTFKDYGDMSLNAARFIVSTARKCVGRDGFFTLVLSGGSTPVGMYRLLADKPFRDSMPWEATHLFWGDERCVPPDHTDSNYRSVNEACISKVPVPTANIHRIRGEMGDAKEAAEIYEKEIRDFFRKCDVDYCSPPQFHLILLGVGGDGHTASLFPGGGPLSEEVRWVLSARAPYGIRPGSRITMTLPIINRAERILFLVSGEDKRNVLGRILGETPGDEVLPAGRVRADGETLWYLAFEL